MGLSWAIKEATILNPTGTGTLDVKCITCDNCDWCSGWLPTPKADSKAWSHEDEGCDSRLCPNPHRNVVA